jgi:hypothetical protein
MRLDEAIRQKIVKVGDVITVDMHKDEEWRYSFLKLVGPLPYTGTVDKLHCFKGYSTYRFTFSFPTPISDEEIIG